MSDTNNTTGGNTSHEAVQSKSSSEAGAYIVCEGATCKCSNAMNPALYVNLIINSQDKAYINGSKLVATIKDSQLVGGAAPFVQCSKNNTNNAKPCVYAPADWVWNTSVGEEHPEIDGKKILTENAIIKCPNFQGEISIVDHGQKIDVLDDSIDELDDSAAIAIVCLYEKVKSEPSKGVVPNVQSISHGNYTSAEKIVEIPLRVNSQYEFTAKYKYKNADSKPLYSFWFIRPQKENEGKNLKFNAEEGLLYKQQGDKIAIKIGEEGNYYIEGFGRLTHYNSGTKKTTYKSQIFKNCAFLLKVQKNKFKNLNISPKPVERISETEFEIWVGQHYRIEVDTLFELTDKEKEIISFKILDDEDNIVKIYSYEGGEDGEVTDKSKNCSIIPISDGIYYLHLNILEEAERIYTFRAIRNKLDKIISASIPPLPNTKQRYATRPNTTVEFTSKLMDIDKPDLIYWFIDDNIQDEEHDLTFEYTFDRIGTFNVHAELPQLFGRSKSAPCNITVKNNAVTALRSDPLSETNFVGSSIFFTVETVYKELLKDRKEGIIWEIKSTNTNATIKDAKPVVIQSSQKSEEVFEGTPIKFGNELNLDKGLEIKFNQIGEYEISAKMENTDSCSTKKIKIEFAHIEEWTFVDSEGNYRKNIGWGQEFYIKLKVKGWENKEISLQLWHDTQAKREAGKSITTYLKKVDAEELKSRLKVESDGTLTVKISDSSFWTNLQNVTDSDTPALFFTAYNVDSLCDNWKQTVYDGLDGHIYPDKSDGTYAYIPNKTRYRGYFANAGGNILKQIIQYNDAAKIVVWIDNKKGDDLTEKEYNLHLIENKTGDDYTYPLNKFKFDNEGKFIFNINLEALRSNKDENHPKQLPRFFYFRIKDIGTIYDSFVYTYPEEYGLGKDNDTNIISFDKADYLADDIKLTQNFIDLYSIITVIKKNHLAIQGELFYPQMIIDLEKEEERIRKEEEEKNKEYRSSEVEKRNEISNAKNENQLKQNRNYYLQLKIAEDASVQNSRFTNTAKKIGQPLVEKENNRKGDCPRCNEDITLDQMKKIFPECEDNDKLTKSMEAFNTYMEVFKLNTCWNKAHFFAQARSEVGTKLKIKEENFDYSTKHLIEGDYIQGTNWVKGDVEKKIGGYFTDGEFKESPFSYYRKNKAQANAHGRKDLDKRLDGLIQKADTKAIANTVYPKRNGNNMPGDGWKFRGRGFVQLTGRGNYSLVNDYTSKYANLDIISSDSNIDSVGEPFGAVVSSMGYWISRNMHNLSNGCNEVDIISKCIGTDHAFAAKSKDFHELLKDVFKLEECQWEYLQHIDENQELKIKEGIAWLDSIAISQEDAAAGKAYKVPYENNGNRINVSGENKMDCSELVGRYLAKIEWCSKPMGWATSYMYDYAKDHPDWLEKHDDMDYKPKPGDIFLWASTGGFGHTGVVIHYDELTDIVTTIEAISSTINGERIIQSGSDRFLLRLPKKLNEENPLKGVVKMRFKRDSKHLINHRVTKTQTSCRYYTPKVHCSIEDKKLK